MVVRTVQCAWRVGFELLPVHERALRRPEIHQHELRVLVVYDRRVLSGDGRVRQFKVALVLITPQHVVRLLTHRQLLDLLAVLDDVETRPAIRA